MERWPNSPDIEVTIREVLGIGYDVADTQTEAQFISGIATILEDESKSKLTHELLEGEEASAAASEIRMLLWKRYGGGGAASASSTCNLFLVLGRVGELGWVTKEINGFKLWQQERFLNELNEVRNMKMRMSGDILE